MKQKRVFVEREADQYFRRNHRAMEAMRQGERSDPALELLDRHPMPCEQVLEVGCSNGWRIDRLADRFPESRGFGIEPSFEALQQGQQQGKGFVPVQGTADRLPFADRSFDLLIFGFCLYLCDREDLFRIAAEADRVLRAGGRLLLLDFHAEAPVRRRYHHAPGLFSYKTNYADMFLWNPQYIAVDQQVVREENGARLDVALLEKQRVAEAYPEESE